jgi:hypothetical protein
MPISRRTRELHATLRAFRQTGKTPRLRPVRNASNGMYFLLAWISATDLESC